MNESNKNDSISFKNIMTTNCTDWNISDQLNNKIETHWSSTKQNKLNNDQIKKENFFENYQHKQQNNQQQLINRSKVMLNGVDKIYDQPEKKEKNYVNKNYMNKNDISLHQFKNLTNNFDNFDKLSSSSLSNSIKNVSNVLKNNSGENISLSSLSFDRSPYRTFFPTSDKQQLYESDKYQKKESNYEFNSSNNFNLSFNDTLSPKQQNFNFDSARRDSNTSNQIRKNSNQTLISLKKLNLSLPLKNENNLMDNSNRKLPSTISKNDLKETSKILQNSKYTNDFNNDKKDNRKNTVNFLENHKEPNFILAQQQINFDKNRSLLFNDKEERAKTTNKQLDYKNESKKILKFSSTSNFEKTNQSEILSKKLTNNLIDESLELNKLNTDLLKLRKDLNQFNDELLKVDKKIKDDNQFKKDILVNNQQIIDKINRIDEINQIESINNQNKIINTNEINKIDKIHQQQLSNQLINSTFIDYNPINLKLNSKLVHLIRHSELDRKSNLLLNLVQENHCGIILCKGQSTIVNAQCSIGYYIGAITLNSTAQQLLTIGDLVLEINSIPLHFNMTTMNLDKVTNLMNSYFNLNRCLQLRIVPRALLMNQFRQTDSTNNEFNNDSIRTIVVNAQKQKSSTSKYAFGLTISGGSEYGLGIFVSNVDRGSLSEQSGLKRGDLIITLNGHDFLNLTHDHAALLIRNNSILILRVRNVGFVPISALLLDQNDDTTNFRCNSAIELTDYSRFNLRKQNMLNKLPIELIKDELKINGLLNRNEIKDYLINKYGLINELNQNKIKSEINYLIDDYEKLDDNYLSKNLSNDLIKNDHFYLDRQLTDDILNKVPYIKFNNNLKNMPLSSKLNLINNENINLLSNKLSSLPDSSLLNTSSSSVSNSLLNTSPLQNLSLHNISTNDNLSQYLINKTEFNNLIDNQFKKELQLDEQINLLFNNNDRFNFNFYKNEYLNKNISLNLFIYSISCLIDTPEKCKIFKYLRPLIPKTDLLRFDQLISIYDHQQNYLLSNEDELVNKLYRSNSYDDNLIDREHWINTSYFNKNQNFGSIDNYLHNPQVQLNRFNSNYHHFLHSRNNSFPLLNQLPSQFKIQSGNLINSMSPYHCNQTTDFNNIQNNLQNNNPSISSSASPYLNSFLQNRIITGNNCTTSKSNLLNNSLYHPRNQPINTTDENNLTDSYSSHLNNIPFTNNVQTTYTNNFHPSLNNYKNLPTNNNVNNLPDNFLDFNEQNQLTPDLRDPIMSYQNSQNLIANHNMVRRHRSLPAGSFQREFNYYPNKHFIDPAHQRSSSFKLPPRRAYERDEDCFRVRISKNKPIFGIAIEGGINVPNQTLPRIISIHEDGSAFESQLKVGHIILEINGVSTDGLTHSEIARLLAHSYYTNQDNFIELLIKEKQTDTRRNSLLMLNNNYG